MYEFTWGEGDWCVRAYANVCVSVLDRGCVCVSACAHVCVYSVSVCICTCFSLYMPMCMSQMTEREAECVSLWNFEVM